MKNTYEGKKIKSLFSVALSRVSVLLNPNGAVHKGSLSTSLFSSVCFDYITCETSCLFLWLIQLAQYFHLWCPFCPFGESFCVGLT